MGRAECQATAMFSAVAETVVAPAETTSTGAVELLFAPLPSSPYVPSPHAYTAPEAVTPYDASPAHTRVVYVTPAGA